MATLTAALIVRDEAEHIRACLASVAPHVDAMVVVDTGSTDDTATLAADAGAEVHHFAWCDDFAAARNASLDAVRTPWALVIDADERLEVVDGVDLRTFLAEHDDATHGWVPIDSLDALGRVAESSYAVRLLRVDRGLRFRHPVHEQVELGDGPGLDAPCRLRHLGHTDAGAARQRQRYYAELLQRLPEDDPHRLFFAIRDHLNEGRWGALLADAEQYVAHGRRSPSDALVRFYAALAANNQGDLDEAERWVTQGLDDYPVHPDLRLVAMTTAARRYLGDLAAISAPGHPLGRQLGETRHLQPAVRAFLAALGAGDG